MRALTIRVPDDKYERLKALSQHCKMSVNMLIDEMATLMLAAFDARRRSAGARPGTAGQGGSPGTVMVAGEVQPEPCVTAFNRCP